MSYANVGRARLPSPDASTNRVDVSNRAKIAHNPGDENLTPEFLCPPPLDCDSVVSATLASGDVDLCLVPESDIVLDGPRGCLPHIMKRVRKKNGRGTRVSKHRQRC